VLFGRSDGFGPEPTSIACSPAGRGRLPRDRDRRLPRRHEWRRRRPSFLRVRRRTATRGVRRLWPSDPFPAVTTSDRCRGMAAIRRRRPQRRREGIRHEVGRPRHERRRIDDVVGTWDGDNDNREERHGVVFGRGRPGPPPYVATPGRRADGRGFH
jgi:hypothetical protein